LTVPASLAGQHVNQKILHLNESLEFIDASSDEEDCELSPSNKRSRICDLKRPSPSPSVVDKVIKEAIKDINSENCDSNQEFKAENCENREKHLPTSNSNKASGEIKSNKKNYHSESFPVIQKTLLQDEDYMKPNKDTAAEESEEKKKRNDIELTGSGSSDLGVAAVCRTEGEAEEPGQTVRSD